MKPWLEQLSDYIDDKESDPPPFLSEEFQEMSQQTDLLLEASEQLESIYAQIRERLENVSR